MDQAASTTFADLMESLNNPSAQAAFRDKYFLLHGEYRQSFQAYEDIAILLSGHEWEGRDIAQEAFLRAFINLDEWNPEQVPCQTHLICLIHGIVEEHEERQLAFQQSTGIAHSDWLGRTFGPSAQLDSEQTGIKTEFRQCIGDMPNLSVQERLALFAQICSGRQIGNILAAEGVDPEHLASAMQKCAQNPALYDLMSSLDN